MKTQNHLPQSVLMLCLMMFGFPTLAETSQDKDKVAADSSSLMVEVKQAFQDGIIKGKLEAAIIGNKHLSVFDIDSDVNGDQVILTGEVKSEIEKELAKQVALGISGVEEVENNIKVNPKVEPSKWTKTKGEVTGTLVDGKITTFIKSRLMVNDFLTALSVNVDTDNGKVTLRGEVDSEIESALVEQIAKNTKGVVEVSNQLRVKKSS